VETDLQRIGDADDLEDAAFDEPVRASPDGRLGHAEVGRDLGERPAAILLEVLDDPLVERRELLVPRSTGGAGSGVGAGVCLPIAVHGDAEAAQRRSDAPTGT
jgi:hypothetical protein